MFYTKITEIKFNNEKTLSINPNDIVIFVGPNNSGKSQSLRDIYKKISNDLESVVVKDVMVSKGNLEELKTSVKTSSKELPSANTGYSGYGYEIYNSFFAAYNINMRLNEGFRPYLVDFLKTEDRLQISQPPKAIDAEDRKTHPIHYLIYDKEYQKTVSKYFNEAFGYELTPDYLSKKQVSLLMGQIPQTTGGAAPDVMERLTKQFQSYPKVDEQGDGMRSFTGVILHLILKNYGIYLIDEPESFLHPPQAMILGKVIGELLGDDRQAFISTHSEDVIKGLMEKCPERIKVVRITRQGNTNSFAILDNKQFKTIWGDPLLKHSNIMSSLFHKNVVLCESDSDCRLYSIVLDHLKQKQGKFSETLFTYCSGKQRMKQVAAALRSLSIDFRCVPDIDVLNDKQTLKDLYEACGGTWDDPMESNYNTFSSQLNGGKATVTKQELEAQINAFVQSVNSDSLTRNDIDNLSKTIKLETKWSMLKKGGTGVIPSGQATTSFNALNERLKSVHIHLVYVGELERFIPEVGGHGPSWVNSVLEQYNNLDDAVYAKVNDFVGIWQL